jgi:hypothetical protein
MENSGGGKIPWEDLKYIFGDIMYGGHIVNDFDRLMSTEYLNFIMKDELLDETEMFPFNEGENASFKCPAPTTQVAIRSTDPPPPAHDACFRTVTSRTSTRICRRTHPSRLDCTRTLRLTLERRRATPCSGPFLSCSRDRRAPGERLKCVCRRRLCDGE